MTGPTKLNYYVVLTHGGDYDEVARDVRGALGLGDRNHSAAIREQRRYGENWGGTYYLFEWRGVLVYLLQNAEDTVLPFPSDEMYYALIPIAADTDDPSALLDLFVSLLRENGLPVTTTSVER